MAKIINFCLKLWSIGIRDTTKFDTWYIWLVYLATLFYATFIATILAQSKIQFRQYFEFFDSVKFGSSHRMCSFKKDVLKNIAKLRGKHLRHGIFLYKVAGLGETVAQVFSCRLCDIIQNNLLQNTSGRLLRKLEFKIY